MPRVAAFAAEARFRHSGASMDGDGCPLAMGDGQGVPAEVGALVNRRYRKMLTNSDGACGIHAFFGSDGPGGLTHADARGFLRQTLGETAGDVLRQCRNVTALDDVMNWAWKQVIKPQAQKHAGLTDRNLGMLDEEMLLWEKIKESNRVLNACLRAVKHDSEMLTVFEQKRAAVATALRNLCENDMQDIFLRPLLVHMGILDEYECEVAAGHRKIDVVGTDTALGQHYRRGIVEYFGVSNVGEFLMHVANTAEAVQDANIAGVFDFVEVVREARENALVVDAGESVLVREPFQDFLKLVYPCYLNALSSHGYFLSDLELLLLCECARLNAVIVRQIQH
mgnify:CR=1 FL=1